MRFNKKMSQMESLYEVAKPVVQPVDPIFVSDFIHHAFENPAQYQLEGISKKWFQDLVSKDLPKATAMVDNLLQENGHLVSKNSILEGVEAFKNDPE